MFRDNVDELRYVAIYKSKPKHSVWEMIELLQQSPIYRVLQINPTPETKTTK